MMSDVGFGIISEIKTSDIIHAQKSYFCATTNPNYRVTLRCGKESPDSTGQSTGEEPGCGASRKQQVPQKITAL